MSETTSTLTTSTGSVYLLFPDKPDYYTLSEIYDPDNPPAAGTKVIVPPVGSLISGDKTESNVLYIVSATNATTYASTLTPVYLADTDDGYGLASVISYGNTKFRAYFDTRSNPYTLTIDRVVFYGGAPATYQIIRYPNDSTKSTVISQYYDASGTYQASSVPMLRLEQNENTWYCQPCNITIIPDDDEELLVKVYSETGSLVATCTVYAKQADIINTALTYRPKIADLQVVTSQPLSDGSGCYIFEKQSTDDLDITGKIVYSDGTTRAITVDDQQTFLYGLDDFVAAYSGQTQNLLLKYFLSYNEVIDSSTSSSVTTTGTSIAREFSIKVVPNDLAVPIKLSIVPIWSSSAAAYTLQYFYYSTNHTKAQNVTSYVTIKSGTFTGNFYTDYQTFSFGLDMNQVDPSTYTTSSVYLQSVNMKLQPYAALVRYVIRDSTSSPTIYGQDSSASRRPVLYYDSTTTQYFIPTTVFANENAVLTSFYYNANPPYDTTTASTPPTPTHFTVRDATSGAMIVASPIALSDYATAFSIIGGATGNYVGANVVVEFIEQLSDGTNLILFGVPVDVYAGTYIG